MSTAAVPGHRSVAGELRVTTGVAAARIPSRSMLVMLAVVVVGGLYVFRHLGRGWMPFDDGALAQSAERWLQGELPHRDFDDIYTGGLAVLNGVGFKLLGTTLWSMRVVLFAVFLAWMPAVYSIARRFVRPIAAAGVTLLAAVWSLPNYPAAMPSWYNLFLATFGTAALLRYLEDRRARWLVAAGIAGGLSFLVKVVGLYYVAAVLLFLVFQEHEDAMSSREGETRRATGYALFVTASLLLFVVVLAALVSRQLHGAEVAHFFVPPTLVAASIACAIWSRPIGPSAVRFRRLSTLIGPFLAGVAAPVALFLLPYAASGALGAFFTGVFVLPIQRFGFATAPMLPLVTMAALIPLALLFVLAQRVGPRAPAWAIVVLGVVVLWLLVGTAVDPALYQFVWRSAPNLLPLLVAAGVVVLARRRPADAERPRLRAQTLLLLSVAALCALVQFPYSTANYFFYVAPLVALAVVALLQYARPMAPALPGLVLAFYALFAVLRTNTATLSTMSHAYAPYPRTVPLRLERAGGVTVFPEQALEYANLIPIVRAHGRDGYVWASPDCPEVYFLSGLRNPTRSLFEFFDPPQGRDTRVLQALDRHRVNVVVLNRAPGFSPWLSNRLLAGLYQRYPHTANVGRFHVRWRS